jgi:hypothetical protein
VRAQPARGRSNSPLAHAAEFVRGLPDHQLLDRLVRGRAWIPVLGLMLAGIVAMQVEVLKLNASMGRSIALASSLQTRNELLRTSVSSLSDAQRIERLATHMGMVMPGPTAVDFLHGRESAGQAVAGIHAPDAAAFDSALQASAATASTSTTSAPPVTPTSTTPTTSGTSTAVAGASTPTTAAQSTTTPSTTPAATTAPTTTAAATPGTTTPAPSNSTGTTNPGGAAPTG